MGKSKEILKIDNKGFLIKTFKSTTECSLIEGFSRKKLGNDIRVYTKNIVNN